MMSYPAGLESSFTTVGLSFNPRSLEQKQIFFFIIARAVQIIMDTCNYLHAPLNLEK